MSLVDKVLGRHLANQEEEEQKVGVFAGIPMLGLDALSSAAYGPEAALTILLPLGALGLGYLAPITVIILVLLAILFFSYRQTIAAYPSGGGSYTVAKENLGDWPGLLAAAALPPRLHPERGGRYFGGHRRICVGGPRPAQIHAHSVPVHAALRRLHQPARVCANRGRRSRCPHICSWEPCSRCLWSDLGKLCWRMGIRFRLRRRPSCGGNGCGGLWLLLRSFASGCTAMTGVEAVSNGVTAFKSPPVVNAQRALGAIVLILGVLLAGIAYLARVYHIGATDPDGPAYQSMISQLVAAVMGHGLFYYVTIGSVLAVLSLSANTSFADFPRLCRLIAQDDYLPHAFANRGGVSFIHGASPF